MRSPTEGSPEITQQAEDMLPNEQGDLAAAIVVTCQLAYPGVFKMTHPVELTT